MTAIDLSNSKATARYSLGLFLLAGIWGKKDPYLLVTCLKCSLGESCGTIATRGLVVSIYR